MSLKTTMIWGGLVGALVALASLPTRAHEPSRTAAVRPTEGGSMKLRMLALHGYRGDARALQVQIEALARDLAPRAQFVFVDAPSLAAGDYGWWHAVRDVRSSERGDPGVDSARSTYRGWPRSRAWL